MIKIDDLVLCKVKKIEGTTVFLEVENEYQGTLSFSEIAAGRIRNIREYVSPNKLIVCKILRIIDGHPELSFRRVTAKEREQVMDKHQKEKTLHSILKTLSPDAQKIFDEIKEKYGVLEFIEKASEEPKIIEKFLPKDLASRLSELLIEKSDREKEVKREFIIKSYSDNGIKQIKEILSRKDAQIKYLGSSKFLISKKAKEFKEANLIINNILAEIEKEAKEKKLTFELTKEK